MKFKVGNKNILNLAITKINNLKNIIDNIYIDHIFISS